VSGSTAADGRALRLAAVVVFRDEASHLPTMFESIESQTRPADELVLVDDGSRDGSHEIAATFAERSPGCRVIRRTPRRLGADRLADAGELLAFQAGVRTLAGDWDIVAKLDADLQLHHRLFEAVRERFATIGDLGVTGSFLSAPGRGGRLEREPRPADHVEGPNKFYRRECFEEISPIPAILGWDTIDDLRARSAGWSTESFALPDGESVHLRPMGRRDGRLRAFRRWGRCAWGYGSHPIWVLAGGVYRMGRRPLVIGGLNYVWGWCMAASERAPRAEPAIRELARREELAELRLRLLGGM
jgi:glycosyltransferase involved in cell wall biosynthesis